MCQLRLNKKKTKGRDRKEHDCPAHIGNLEDEEMKAAEYLSDSLADEEAEVT